MSALPDRTLILIGVGAAAVLALVGYLAARKAGQTLAANANLINPLSTDNLVYRGAGAVLQAFTGRQEETLGTWFYGMTHSEIDPTRYTQAELERILAAKNRWGRDSGGWFVG